MAPTRKKDFDFMLGSIFSCELYRLKSNNPILKKADVLQHNRLHNANI